VPELNEKNERPDVTEMYYFALKSKVTRDKYKRRLENFFNFIGINGESFQDKCNDFCKQSKLKGNKKIINIQVVKDIDAGVTGVNYIVFYEEDADFTF
jgi:hypothetical protein